MPLCTSACLQGKEEGVSLVGRDEAVGSEAWNDAAAQRACLHRVALTATLLLLNRSIANAQDSDATPTHE